MDPPDAMQVASDDRLLNLDCDERRMIAELLKIERFRLTVESRHAEDTLALGRLRRRLDIVERIIRRFERSLATDPEPLSEASMR